MQNGWGEWSYAAERTQQTGEQLQERSRQQSTHGLWKVNRYEQQRYQHTACYDKQQADGVGPSMRHSSKGCGTSACGTLALPLIDTHIQPRR